MDELTAPLGGSPAAPRRLATPATRALALALGVGLLIFALWAAGGGLPFGRESTAVTPAPQRVEAQAPAARPETDPTGAVREPADGDSHRTVTIIDGMSGKRQEVVIGSPQPAPSAAPVQRSR